MPLTPILSVDDGPKMTVGQLIKAPGSVGRRLIQLAQNAFLADSVLRQGPPTGGGFVTFLESSPLFMDDDVEIVAEYGEIPVLGTSEGTLQVVKVTKRAGAIVISKEMEIRNDIDAVNVQQSRLKNTMVKSWDTALFNAIVANTSVQTSAATATWGGSTGKIRHDILTAQELVRAATPTATQGSDTLGFEPDTLIVPGAKVPLILDDSDFNSVFVGNIADENLRYTGKLQKQILGLDVLVSRSGALGTNQAIVMERGTAGFRSDEQALQATPLYYDQSRQTWRCDVVRSTVLGLDQPKAICRITGV